MEESKYQNYTANPINMMTLSSLLPLSLFLGALTLLNIASLGVHAQNTGTNITAQLAATPQCAVGPPIPLTPAPPGG
jgi:hypothetical protein